MNPMRTKRDPNCQQTPFPEIASNRGNFVGKTKGQDGIQSLPGREELMEQFLWQTKPRQPLWGQCPPRCRTRPGRQSSWAGAIVADTTQPRARAAPLRSARYLHCRWAPTEFIPRQLKASNFSLPKARKKKTKRENSERGKPLLKQGPSSQ